VKYLYLWSLPRTRKTKKGELRIVAAPEKATNLNEAIYHVDFSQPSFPGLSVPLVGIYEVDTNTFYVRAGAAWQRKWKKGEVPPIFQPEIPVGRGEYYVYMYDKRTKCHALYEINSPRVADIVVQSLNSRDTESALITKSDAKKMMAESGEELCAFGRVHDNIMGRVMRWWD
jgi:hypothetical protein